MKLDTARDAAPIPRQLARTARPDDPEVAATGGLRLRPWTGPGELAAMHAIAGSARAAAGLTESSSLEAMANQYAHLTNCDPDRDILLAEVEGRPVAYGRTWWADRNSGERAFEAICFIDPEWRGRGIGTALLAAQDRHRLEQARAMATAGELGDRPAVLTAYVFGPTPAATSMVEAAGYGLARRHAEMQRATLEDIPDLPLPDGLGLRSVARGDVAAMRRAFDVDVEVFRDHWGDVDASDTAWRSWLADPEMQPELWVVAVETATGETAGQILNYTAPGLDGGLIGWTESIAVRRPWRRRGLASAMLAASLRVVRDAGAATAALGVDLQNENRASAIYERLGFRVSAEELEYHRRLRPEELAAGPMPEAGT